MTNLLDLMGGEALAAQGMARAAAHAEREVPAWGAQAFAKLCDYAQRHSHFTAEDLKAWAYQAGLAIPPAPGAWGSVVRRAQREDIIAFFGYRTSRNATRHAQPVKVWRAL